MADADTILAIEARMLRAWPALETIDLGGWRMRFANGYSKRANSVTPLAATARLDAADLNRIEQAYRVRSIKPTIRVFPFAAPAFDATLALRGYARVDPTVAMLCDDIPSAPADPRVSIIARVTPDWARANAGAYGGEKSNDAHLHAILARIAQPSAFATLTDNGIPCAWGIAVADDGYAGLQDIVVRPEMRGRGVGHALVRSLLAWARATGCGRAYLHRLASNQPAAALYAAHGFRDAYTLHYRVQPLPA